MSRRLRGEAGGLSLNIGYKMGRDTVLGCGEKGKGTRTTRDTFLFWMEEKRIPLEPINLSIDKVPNHVAMLPLLFEHECSK
jgi:hypothetical protein